MKKFAKILGFLGFFVTVATVQIGTAWAAGAVRCEAGYYLPAGSDECQECPGTVSVSGTNVGVYCLGSGEQEWFPGESAQGLRYCNDDKACGDSSNWEYTRVGAESEADCNGGPMNGCSCHHPNDFCPDGATCLYNENFTVSGTNFCGTCVIDKENTNTWCPLTCPKSCNNGTCTCPGDDCTGYEEVHNLPGVHYCGTAANACDVTHLIQGENTSNAQIVEANPLNYQCSAYDECKVECSHEGNPTCDYSGAICEWDLNTPAKTGYQQGDDCIDPQTNQPIEPFDCNIIITGCSNSCQYWDANLKQCVTYTTDVTYKCNGTTQQGPTVTCGTDYFVNRNPNAINGNYVINLEASGCVPAGQVFSNWKLSIDNSSHSNDDRFPWNYTDATATFEAQWEEDKLYIHYHRYDGDWVQANPPFEDKEAFTISDLQPNGLTKYWTLTRDNSTFRGWCDDLYYSHLSDATWLNSHCQGPSSYTIPNTVNTDVHLYAWWGCADGYTLSNSYLCEANGIDVIYTCTSPDGNQSTINRSFSNDATVGVVYTIRSVGTNESDHQVNCSFPGYYLENNYLWKRMGSNPEELYEPGPMDSPWAYTSTQTFELSGDYWKPNAYRVLYKCGSINGTPVTGNDTADSATYGQPYYVATNIYNSFINNCSELNGYVVDYWTFEDQTTPRYNTGEQFNNPNGWNLAADDHYFVAHWVQTGGTLTLDPNGGSASNPATLYTTQGTGVYLDSTREQLMSTDNNGLTTNPTKSASVQIYPNGTGANFQWNGSTITYPAYVDDDITLDFTGFYNDNDGEGNIKLCIGTNKFITSDGINIGKNYNVSEPHTWYAHWDSKQVYLPVPTRAGYDFLGWYDASENGNWISDGDENYEVSGDIVLYAHWSVACRSVSFDENGGTSTGGGNNGKFWKISDQTGWYADSTCTSNATPNVENTRPTKEHATFIGYDDIDSTPTVRIFDDLGAITTGGENWTITQDATLYAQYECDDLYHLMDDGSCGSCPGGSFYNPSSTNPDHCDTCADILGSNWTSKEGYTWSIDQCYRNCGTDGNDNVEKCDAVTRPSGHGFEQFVAINDGTGRQISFYGNEQQNIYTCRSATGATKCPLGLLNSENTSGPGGGNRPMAAAVKFNNIATDEKELRYIIGNRAGGDSLSLVDGFAWSQVVGAGQQGPEITTDLGTYHYTFITYPADTAPAATPREHQTFAGYGYPETVESELVSARNLTADNANGIIQFAKNLDPARNNMSPNTQSPYSRNLWPIYTDDPTYTLTYSCGDGGGTPSISPNPVENIYAGDRIVPAQPEGCTNYGNVQFKWWAVSRSIDTHVAGDDGAFNWGYTENKTFTAVWGNANTHSINYEKIPVDDVNTGGPTDHGNTYVPGASGGTLTQFTCGSGITPITGHPYLLDPNGTQIGEVTEWCDNEGLTNNCAATKELSNSDCSEKTVYAKWVCTDPRYHLNGNKDDCVACPDHTFWNGSDCIAETECPDGYTNAHTPYNWSINQCYRFCETKTCEYANDIQFAIGTANFLNPSNNPGSKQIAFYGNEIPGNPNRFNVCDDDSIKYCPRVLIGSGLGSSPLKPRESLVTFMKNGNSSPAGTRYIVGNRSSANYDMDMFTDATKIWSHVVGLGQQGQSTNSSDPRIYTFIIYPTDTAPNPGDTGARFMGYYDAQNGGVQRVAAALGLDSSNSTSNNAIAFSQSSLLQNQIGDRTLYPQYCANGETWNGQLCTGNDYTVKYVCGDHGTASGEMTNTATFGQPYTVAALEGGVLAECTANTGYVLKTNNSGNPLWYFNGDSSADHYTNEVINPWNFTIQSPTFTAQYDCDRGYTWNPDGTACVSISGTACPAQLSDGSHASLVGEPSINGDGKCVYTIKCDLCQTSGVYGCYTHEPISNGQFTITGAQYDGTVLDDVSCTPAKFQVALNPNGGNPGLTSLLWETYGAGWSKTENGEPISSLVLDLSDLPTWADSSKIFNGYNELQNGSGSPMISPTRLVTASSTALEDNTQTWYAQWAEAGSVTITFSCNDGSGITDVVTPVYPPQDISVPGTSLCPRDGYTFTQWEENPAINNLDPISASVGQYNWTHDFGATFVPNWTENKYDVKYVCNDEVVTTNRATYDQTYTVLNHDSLIECTAPDGKVFVGWGFSNNGTIPYVEDYDDGEEFTWQYTVQQPTFTAIWDDGCYAITFDNTRFGQWNSVSAPSKFYKKGQDWYADTSRRCDGSEINPLIIVLPQKDNATFIGYDTDGESADASSNLVFNNIGSLTDYGQTWPTTDDTKLYAKYDCDDDYTLDGTTCVLDSSNFHTITLDENAAEFYGAASNPNVLYTIEGTAQAYTDEEHNDPFSSLNENGFPRKYAKVTFHYCNGTNNSCDNPLTQNEIKDADFIFNGFYATTPANGQRYINSEGDMLPAGNNAAAAATTDTRWYADWNGYGTLEVSRWPVPNQSQTPAGYTFGGWWTSPNCGDIQVISSYQFTTPDTDLYACWSQTVKYVCGDHGTASSEMTNTATFGQSYTVAILDGGALAECTANTGYVLKTNNSGNPLWYFNGDSSADHYTNEVINPWNFNTQSPTFTAQYGCARGYIPNGDVNNGGSCEPGVNYCLAQLPTNPDPHAILTEKTWNATDGCVYTITCDPCNGTTNHSCYTHTDPDSDVNGQFTITGAVGNDGAHVLDNVFCSPSTYTVYYRCNDSASPTVDITSAIYGENYTIRTNGSGIGDVLNCTSNTGQFNGWTFNGSSDPDHLYEGGTELPWTYYDLSPYPLFTAHYGQCDEGEVLINGSCETCTCPQSNWTPTGAVQSCDALPLTENSCQAHVTCNEPYGNPQSSCDGAVCSASCSRCPENQISVGGNCYDICTESCSVPSTDNGCPVFGYPSFVTCNYDVQSVSGYDTGDGKCRYIDGANAGQVIDLGACSMTGVTCPTYYNWNRDTFACERTANYTCGNHGSSTYPMSNIVQYGQSYAVAYEDGTQIANCTQVDDGYTFIDKWTLNTAPLVTNGFGTNNTIWWGNGGQTYFTNSQSPLFTAMYSCAAGYYEPVPDTCCDIATTYWNSSTQQCETCPNGYHPNSNNTDCDPDGPTPDQYHRIALDRNGVGLSGDDSNPINLYTIEDDNVYSDPQRNNPFTILTSNPTKYSTVTFNYCNQNSTTNCSGSQTDSRDAYFEFKGFKDNLNETTINESNPGRLTSYGYNQAIGYTGTADPIATWYAQWSTRSSIAQDQWFTLSDDVRPGYMFIKWTSLPNCFGNPVSYTENNSFTGNSSNDIVYACWKKKCWVNCTWNGQPTNPTTCPSDIANIPYVQNCTYNPNSPEAQGPGYHPYDGSTQCLNPATNEQITPEPCNYTVNCESPRVWDPDTSSCVYPSGTKWNIKFVCDTNNQVVQEYEKSVGELMESIPSNTSCVKPGYSFTQWKDAEHNDTLTAGTTNIPWTHEYNATYTPDWNDGNVYHVTLAQTDATTNATVQDLYEKYAIGWGYTGTGTWNTDITLSNNQLPRRTGYTFGGYKDEYGQQQGSFTNNTWTTPSATTVTRDQTWTPIWTRCSDPYFYYDETSGQCKECESAFYDNPVPGTHEGCYHNCSEPCRQNIFVCNIPNAATYTLVTNVSYPGELHYPGNAGCQLDIWAIEPELNGTIPNCACRVSECNPGYHPNNDSTACVPNSWTVNYYCGDSNAHNGSASGMTMWNTATYGQDYKVAYDTQNTNTQIADCNVRDGYILNNWKLNNSVGSTYPTGWQFTWLYEFTSTTPTFTAQYVCDTDNGYHQINGMCQQCPENSYWTGSQCKQCDSGYHVNDAGNGCIPNTINLVYGTSCGTSNPSSATCTFNSGFNLATHSTSTGYNFNGWMTLGANNGPHAAGSYIDCTAEYLGNAVYTNNATVTITGSCASDDELCPARLPANANLNTSYPLNPTPNAGTCTYHLQCASCIGSNDHDCYTRDGMNSDGTFTVTGPVGNSTVLNNVRCEPATYNAVYKCGAGTPGGSYTDNVTITYNGSYTVLPNGSDGVVTCSKDGEMFNHWAFNLESGRQYTGGESINPWRYHGSTVPTFTAQYGQCPEDEVIVDGECKKECIVPCTWQNYPADPAPCPTPQYPAGTMCHYIAGTNPAYGYRPNPSSRLCLDIDTGEQVEAQTCNVDVTQDPTCPSHYHWNSGTFNCDPDVYTVTLDPNRESYQNNTIVPGSNNVNELKEKWEYGWSKDGGYQFATDSLILNTNTEVPYWTDGTKVFDGYWTTPSGIGYRMVQANGSVSQNGYQLLPATTITSDTTWYARYVDNPGPFTVTFRCDQDGAILNTQNPSFGDYIDVLTAPQSACTNHPGETFNQWRIVANGMLIPAWYNGTSGMYPWQLHEGSQIVPDWRPVYEVTLKKGATDAVPGSVTKLWNASGIGWFGNSDLTQPVSSPLTGSQLPTRQGYSFAGYFIEGTTPPPYRVDQNGNLPGNNVLTSSEVWVADWSQCEQGQYYDVETNSCLPCGSPYTDNPHAIGHEQCYYNCSEDCAWNDSIMTNCNVPHATQYAPVAATYSGQHFWGYNYCSLNDWSSPHPAQAIPACQCRVTECEAGWSVDSISNSCKENDHWSITLNPHLVNNTQGSYSSPRVLYTWHGKGVYLYDDYSQYLMNGNQNPLVSNPQTYATVTFNLNGDGAWLDWENQRYTDPVDIDVPLTYLGFYKSETDSDMVINTNRYIEPAGTQAGKTATANLEWHAHWQPRQISTVTGLQLPQPSRPGFNFVGWFNNTSASNGGTQIYATTPVAQNMTVYARWTKETYTITLNANNCQASATTLSKLYEQYDAGWSRSQNDTFTRDLILYPSELPTPANSDQVFIGYYTSRNTGGDMMISANGTVIADPIYTSDQTWYARCVTNNGPFTVQFKCSANDAPIPGYDHTNVQYDDYINVPTVAQSGCSQDGATFTKWKASNHNIQINANVGSYQWSHHYGEVFTPDWNSEIYYVTLDQNGASTPGASGLYEKYDMWWSQYQNGNPPITFLSGSDLPSKTGFNFGGYADENDRPVGSYNPTNNRWNLPDNTTVSSNGIIWTAIWTPCTGGQYWDGNKCYQCPTGFTDNPSAVDNEDYCYGNCQYDCRDVCPSTNQLPEGMESCTPNTEGYPQLGIIYYGTRLQGCLPGGTYGNQPGLPNCESIITCKPGYHLVNGVCVEYVKTDIMLNPNGGTWSSNVPSEYRYLYTIESTGVYRNSARTEEMTPDNNVSLHAIPSNGVSITLDANGGSVTWGGEPVEILNRSAVFEFLGFYDSQTPGFAAPYILPQEINGDTYAFITTGGQSAGMGYTTTPHTWYAQWNRSVALPTPERQNYTFVGWVYNGELVSNPWTVPVNATNITLAAQWTKNNGAIVAYKCDDGNGGIGGTGYDTQHPAYFGENYNVLPNGIVNGGVVNCSKPANIALERRYHEFEDWVFSGDYAHYDPGEINWTFNADNPTFNAHYKECPNGWYFDGSCKQCLNGYTNSDIDADSASKCYKTCDVPCTQPTSQCPMNEEGVLTCTYPNNTYPLGKQYSGSDNCIYDGTAPACEPFTIMCKPGYTPDYYLSTDTGTHCTKLADHEITLDPNGGTGGQEKLYTTYNTGVYLDQARTLRMRLNQNYLTDLPEKTAIATFNYCDDNGANCDGNPTTRSVSVDLGLKGYYQTATNNTRYLEPVPNIAESKLRITDGGDTAGQSYQDNTHTWYAQWSPTAIGNSRWPANPANHTAQCKTYTFNNWWTDPHGGTSVDYNTEISENVTWYAHWCESCPTGTIDHGSCSVTNCKASFTCNDGYYWNADNCACTATGLTLTYQPNGGTPDADYTENRYFGETFTTRGGNTYTKVGHIIAKWANVGAGGSFPLLAHSYTYNYNGNTTLEPEWKQCTCTFNGNSGVESCDANIVTNNTCTPDVVCKPGYVNGHYTCTNEHLETCSAQCDICPAGTYQNGDQCSPCTGNNVSAAGATVCELCDPGYTANPEHTQCVGNLITIDWDENGGEPIPSNQNGSCKFCTNGCDGITCESCVAHPDNDLTLANAPAHNNSAMQFLGWKLFMSDSTTTYPAGTNVKCTYDNVGVYSGTSTAIQAQWNECQCNYSDEDHVQGCWAIYTSGICMCSATCMPGYELIDNTYTCTPSCIPETYSEGITYKPNGGTPNRNYTQSVAYNATFTTFDWSVEHYTKAHHILAGWAVESGGVGTFDGTAALNTTYTYRTDGPTSLLAEWTECANDEISFSTDNECHQCTCDAPNCNSYATDENKCACDATCPTGYTYDGCNCNGTVCEPICNKKQSDAIYVCGDDATGTPPATQTMSYGDTHTVQSPFQPQGYCSKPHHTFMTWLFSGDGNYHNPGDAIVWNYTEDKTFTGKWCETCVQPSHGSCEGPYFAGSCSYDCSCEPGYRLVGDVCTAHPVCEPDSSLKITYRPNGGVNPQTGNNQPVLQPVTYWDDFTTLRGTTFTKDNHILTRWDLVGDDTSTFDKHQDPDTNQYYAKLNEYYDHYNTLGDTILDAHWEQCTCTTGNGVSSCTTSSTSENACACAGECAVRYIDGGCTCNGTTSCTQTCTECPAGYISNADQTECVICPENTYQSGNTCEQCPTGYTSPAGSTSIEDCYNNPVSYTVHYSSNNGLDQTETQPVVYGTTFTTLGGTTFTYDNHIMTRWNKISGGDYTELSHPYEYGVQEDTFLKAQWAQCTCATGNGVSSCTTSSTSENACACTGECAAGYVKGECSCSGNTCTQSCTKCADNQVEINGVCVDCSCSADGDGVVSGCGFVSNENNVCNWGTTTCDTGYNNPGDLSCDDSVHNNNCRAICSQIQSNAIYECGTGTGIPPVSELVDYGTQYIIKANAAVYGCHRENSRFAGWEFDGTQETYWPGDAVTWNYTEDRHFRAVYCNECLTDDHCTLDIPNPGECVVICHTGYEWDSNLKKCVAKTYPGDEGITYKPNGGTPNQNYTQTVKYDASFTTLDWSAEHYTKAHHILTRWDVESGGAGTFNGGYAALGTEYTYHTDGATSLLAKWIECGINEISLDNRCQQCQCTENEGVTSCTTSATNDDTCSCTGECAAGYINAGCNCNRTSCTQSCTKCADNQVSVNNVCEDCVCNVNDDSGATSCGTKSVIDNMCNWGPATCRPGYAYPTIICDGSNNQLCEASCTICDAGYYGPDGLECIQCPEGYTSLPGATSIRECFVDPNSCGPDEHIEHGECVSNTRACSIPDATSAVRIWNPAIGTYGPCTVEVDGCKPGYHVSGNVCVKDTEACTVEHGHGEHDWNGTSWGACGDVVCDPGYEPNSDYTACVECSNRRVNGDIAVSGYIYECEIAACMYQGQKYALQNGECVPICEDASDYTGTKVWDERTKKCIRTCKPGYKMW